MDRLALPRSPRTALALAGCCVLMACGTDPEPPRSSPQPASQPAAVPDSVQRLDLQHRTLGVPVPSALTAPEEVKRVQVEIPAVRNPGGIRLQFEVHVQSDTGEKTLLGTFALFPVTNPGTFLVPTQGRLRAGHQVILSMIPLDPVAPDDPLTVTVGRIAFQTD